MLRMKVVSLSVDPLSNLPLVLLVDESGHTHLPVAVGLGEASAIAAELDGIELERLMTHQLACDLLARAGAEVVGIELDLDPHGAIAARILLELVGGKRNTALARPSDALAIALRSGAGIVASPALLESAARPDRPRRATERAGTDELPLLAAEGGAELLAALDAGAFGKWKM
jgi:bifunctional DNase/RNase